METQVMDKVLDSLRSMQRDQTRQRNRITELLKARHDMFPQCWCMRSRLTVGTVLQLQSTTKRLQHVFTTTNPCQGRANRREPGLPSGSGLLREPVAGTGLVEGTGLSGYISAGRLPPSPPPDPGRWCTLNNAASGPTSPHHPKPPPFRWLGLNLQLFLCFYVKSSATCGLLLAVETCRFLEQFVVLILRYHHDPFQKY